VCWLFPLMYKTTKLKLEAQWVACFAHLSFWFEETLYRTLGGSSQISINLAYGFTIRSKYGTFVQDLPYIIPTK
jgi:hypothetical protein